MSKPFGFKFHPKPVKISVSSPAPPHTPAVPAPNSEITIHDEIPSSFRGKPKPPRNLSMNRRYHGVHSYWDLDTAGLPPTCTASTLKMRIDSALKRFNPNLYLEDLIGFGDTSKFKPGDVASIKKQFKRITSVNPREKICKPCSKGSVSYQKKTDLADVSLFTDMLLYAMDIRPPGNILMITDDLNLASSISELKERGFTMFLAHLEGSDESLINSASVSWIWKDMTDGNAPHD